MLGRVLKDLFASKVRLRPVQTAFEAGVEAYEAGKLAAAAEHFAGTLRAEPEHLQAHTYAGGIDLRTGRFREALEHFERGRTLDRKTPSAISARRWRTGSWARTRLRANAAKQSSRSIPGCPPSTACSRASTF